MLAVHQYSLSPDVRAARINFDLTHVPRPYILREALVMALDPGEYMPPSDSELHTVTL